MILNAHPPTAWDQILFVGTPALYHKSPISGDLQYKPRALKQAVSSRLEGWWTVLRIGVMHASTFKLCLALLK
jgi:hypothetical protein